LTLVVVVVAIVIARLIPHGTYRARAAMPLPLVLMMNHRRRHRRPVSIRPDALMVRHAFGKIAAASIVSRHAVSVVVVLLRSSSPSTLQRVLEVDGRPLREVGLGDDVLVELLLVR
jgi:hypothetical protein